MKGLSRILIIVMLITLLIPPTISFASYNQGTIISANVEVYSEPSITADVNYKLSKGNVVVVSEKLSNGWYKISSRGRTGFVSGLYISEKSSVASSVDYSIPSDENAKFDSNITLQQGCSGADVVKLQQKLKKLGYYTGYITGNFYTSTTSAVSLFQEINGIPVTGIADPTTLTILTSSAPLSAFPCAPTSVMLQDGDYGNNVRLLQQALYRIGLYSGECNGFYGELTADAVEQFQDIMGQTKTGKASYDTQLDIYNMTGVVLSNASVHGEVMTATVEEEIVAPKVYVPLKNGSKGEEVTTLQNRLKELGFFKDKVVGVYGKATTASVKNFQKANKLSVTGVADQDTLSLLYGTANIATPTPVPTPEVPNSNIILKKGDKSSQVALMQNRLCELGYLSKSNVIGTYGNQTYDAVKSFQSNNGITVNGIAGTATLQLLYSNNAKAKNQTSTQSTPQQTPPPTGSGVEMINWFQGGDSTFPRGSVVTITDVKTGTTFKVKRFGGSNHADVEPLTAEDTAIMKQLYGGSWKWDRRSIIVEIGGRRIAASMNGMPHGIDWLNGNNFAGHFCIHFYKSKLHSRAVEDPAHQQAVMNAYNAYK